MTDRLLTQPSANTPEGCRVMAGLSLEEAAARARVSPSYLRRIERRGGAPYCLVQRLCRIYACSGSVFLYNPLGSGTLKTASGRRRNRPGASRNQEPSPQQS